MARATHLTAAFLATVARHGKRPALSHKAKGTWKTRNYEDYGRLARLLALALLELGVQEGDRVALLSENRPEWVMADQAILMAGAVTVPLYPTLTASQTAYILNNSEARLIFLSTEAQVEKLMTLRGQLPHLEHAVVMNEIPQRPDQRAIFSWDDLIALGSRVEDKHQADLNRRMSNLGPSNLATIVYTSGTTGEPKGAMLTHGNLMSNVAEVVPLIGLKESDSSLSFLPLSHVLERISNFSAVAAGAHVYFAQSVESVADDLVDVRPTMLTSVPRLFEKIKARVLDRVSKESLPKRAVFEWARQVGEAYVEALQQGAPRPFDLAFKQQVADAIVFSKIRDRTGGRLRLCISGGAPLASDVGRFFAMLGIEIVEGYGLTETSPVVAFNRPGEVRFGTVGRPLPGVEVRLAEDGELLVRGPNVMAGYFRNAEATRQAIDEDGFFHTGDVAEIDPDGRIRIVDRKKEIIVMSNGKNVAPQPIENALKSSQLIEQAMLIGDRRNYITALIVPNPEALESFAKEQRLVGLSHAELLGNSQVQALFAREIDSISKTFARYEQVKRFTLLPRAFDPNQDEMTPTLKVKRRVIQAHFQAEIEAMYAEESVTA
ncbi:MAG: long-chain fatty acid--CoA ligase [Candidatus Sericytochromatia bacterium]|nr:long-chain fatty acid--CoA ligase [Candidatus Sericytochromatia bacterium]